MIANQYPIALDGDRVSKQAETWIPTKHMQLLSRLGVKQVCGVGIGRADKNSVAFGGDAVGETAAIASIWPESPQKRARSWWRGGGRCYRRASRGFP